MMPEERASTSADGEKHWLWYRKFLMERIAETLEGGGGDKTPLYPAKGKNSRNIVAAGTFGRVRKGVRAAFLVIADARSWKNGHFRDTHASDVLDPLGIGRDFFKESPGRWPRRERWADT